MKEVAGSLKLELAQYREAQSFEKFGSDLDQVTQFKLSRGPSCGDTPPKPARALDISKQIITIFAGIKGFLDSVLDQVVGFVG